MAGERGVTLIELMLAFLILCSATISASGIISYGHRGTKKDFRRVEALQLLTEKMNRLCAISFSKANSYLTSAGVDSYTFTDPVEGISLGRIVVPSSKDKFRASATLKRQAIAFPPMMKLTLPNPGYLASDVTTWQLEDTGNVWFDGVTGVNHYPYRVLKISVKVEPLDCNPPELAVEAMSFITDLEL